MGQLQDADYYNLHISLAFSPVKTSNKDKAWEFTEPLRTLRVYDFEVFLYFKQA